MIDMLGDFWQVIVTILLASAISSFFSSKLGKIVSIFITIISVVLAILFAAGGVPGSEDFLLLGIIIFPALSWTAFHLGRISQKKFHGEVIK